MKLTLTFNFCVSQDAFSVKIPSCATWEPVESPPFTELKKSLKTTSKIAISPTVNYRIPCGIQACYKVGKEYLFWRCCLWVEVGDTDGQHYHQWSITCETQAHHYGHSTCCFHLMLHGHLTCLWAAFVVHDLLLLIVGNFDDVTVWGYHRRYWQNQQRN